MIRLPPISTRTDTLFPYTTLFRSLAVRSPAGCRVPCLVGGARPGNVDYRRPAAYPGRNASGFRRGTGAGHGRARPVARQPTGPLGLTRLRMVVGKCEW